VDPVGCSGPTAIAVPLDGSIEPLTHVFEVAPEGSQRDTQIGKEGIKGRHRHIIDQLVDLVEAFGAVHGLSCRSILAHVMSHDSHPGRQAGR
jgi:hypothetical protein